MERGFLLILVALGFAVNQIYAVPAEACPGDITSLNMANLNDCHSYYKCSYGVSKLTECPDGLMFNAKFRMCDTPDLSGCETSSRKFAFNCVEGGKRYVPHPLVCNLFYDCLTETQGECIKGLLFNPDEEFCDLPQYVQCKNFICVQGGDRYVRHQTECDVFYDCVDGIQMTCANGLLFNPVIQACDWPSYVDC